MGDGQYFAFFVNRMITCFDNFLTVVVLFVQQTKIRDGNIDSNVLNWFTRSCADGFDQVGELVFF